jgi:hypothetical protein
MLRLQQQQILELAQTGYSSYVAKNPHEQARLIKTLVSNSAFDRGSLSPTYVKPFDVFAKGSDAFNECRADVTSVQVLRAYSVCEETGRRACDTKSVRHRQTV